MGLREDHEYACCQLYARPTRHGSVRKGRPFSAVCVSVRCPVGAVCVLCMCGCRVCECVCVCECMCMYVCVCVCLCVCCLLLALSFILASSESWRKQGVGSLSHPGKSPAT